MTEMQQRPRPVGFPSRSAQPLLCLFEDRRSGRCRRVDGFLAQVLQRRRNHETFRLCRVPREQRPDLHERFRIHELPTLLVVEGRVVRGRLESPHGVTEIEDFLAPWLH